MNECVCSISGMMPRGENGGTRRRAYPSTISSAKNPICTNVESISILRDERPAPNLRRHSTVCECSDISSEGSRKKCRNVAVDVLCRENDLCLFMYYRQF